MSVSKHPGHIAVQPARIWRARPHVSRRGAALVVAAAAAETSRSAAATAHASSGSGSRRAALCASAAAAVALLFSAPPAHAVAAGSLEAAGPEDVPGVIAELAARTVEARLEQLEAAVGVAPDAAAAAQAEAEAALELRRSSTVITVPGLSSFSFVHGALFALAALGFAWSLRVGQQQQQVAEQQQQAAQQQASEQQQQQQQQSSQQPVVVDPLELESLRVALADAAKRGTFSSPTVHAALDDMRADVANVAKYRGDPEVMAAVAKLLEIEGILERF